MELVLSAFRPDRPAWPDDPDDEDLPDSDEDTPSPEADEERRLALVRRQRAKEKIRHWFDLLLDQMLHKKHGGRSARTPLSLALYATARLRPAATIVRSWIWRILGSYSAPMMAGDPLALTSALLLIASDNKGNAVNKARQYLLDHRIDPTGVELDGVSLSKIIDLLHPDWAVEEFLGEVQATRTPAEEVRDFLAAAATGIVDGQYPILMKSRHWHRLNEALRDPLQMERVKVTTDETACPKCHIAFSSMALDELVFTGVTQCCRLVVRTVSP